MSSLRSKQLGGVMLISGTAIGVGMLASPIATGASGILTAIALLLSLCGYTLITLFVYLEALYYSDDASINLVSLCQNLSGNKAAIFAWVLFLGLLYIVAAAYILTIGGVIASAHPALNDSQILSSLLFTLIFAFISVFGIKWIDRANRFLTLSLLFLFVVLVTKGSQFVTLDNLKGGQPIQAISALPAVVTAYTFQIILPSIRQYLDNDLKLLRQTLKIGCLIPLSLYLIWHVIILGLLPFDGPESLQSILSEGGDQVSHMISAINFHHKLSGFSALISGFTFFAISTSFWGVMVSLMDFISDGLNLKRFKSGHLYALLLAFSPPLLLAIFAPSSFLDFVKYAGIIILALYGLLPIYLIYNARYRLMLHSPARLNSGKPFLFALLLVTILLIIISVTLS
jgi:tyrosine-specific transport protein